MAEKKKHADGYGSQKWIVKEEVRAKAGLELADVIFTPEKARKPSKKSTAAVAGVTAAASGSGSASSSATSSSHSLQPATASTPVAEEITGTNAEVAEEKTVPPPATQKQSKTKTQTKTQTQQGALSPVKKVPLSKGSSSTHRTPSTNTSATTGTAAKSSSLLRFFNKPVTVEKSTVLVTTQDRPPVTDTISDGETGESAVEEGKEEEERIEATNEEVIKEGKKEEIEAAKEPILIIIEDSNQSFVIPPKV